MGFNIKEIAERQEKSLGNFVWNTDSVTHLSQRPQSDRSIAVVIDIREKIMEPSQSLVCGAKRHRQPVEKQ